MKKYLTILLLTFAGCQSQPAEPVIRIALVNHNQSLQITGLDAAIMADINREDTTSWQTLFPVYKMPADTEMMNYQPVQPGRYRLKDSILLFTPDTALAKRQTYFMRYNRFGSGKSIEDYVKGRARPNQTIYTDLIFKP